MKNAILLTTALVCLFGYTQADSAGNCTLQCSAIANQNLSIVTTGSGVSIAVDINLKYTATIGSQYGFFVLVGTNITILVHKDSNSVLYIDGSTAVYITSQSVSVIFNNIDQISVAITTIISQCQNAGASARATFNFSVLLQANTTIDYSLLITGNANVATSVRVNFGAALTIVKATIGKLSISSVSIYVFIAVSFQSAESVDLELVEAFDLSLQAGGDLKVIIEALLVAYNNNRLTILIAVLKIGDSVQNQSNYQIIRLTVLINGSNRLLVLVYGSGNFYLSYSTVGQVSSTITLIVNQKKSLTCITNSMIGFTLIIVGDLRILYCHVTGVGVIFNGTRVAILTAIAVGVNVQGAAVTQLLLIAYATSSSAVALVQTGVTITVFVNACASGSATALINAFSSVQASVVVVVYNTFGQLFARFKGFFSASIDLAYLARLCLLSSVRSVVVSAFGTVIDAFAASITISINIFTLFYAACSGALSVLFNFKIVLGGSISIG